MPEFLSQGYRISYLDEGVGEAVVLVHGFASNKEVNWLHTGWISLFVESGYRVIAIDNRGHGRSEKIYRDDVYGAHQMAEDVANLIHMLDISPARVMGYSMGARICAFLCLHYPECVKSAVFGGLGIGMVEGIGGAADIVSALEAPSISDVATPQARAFRAFAEQTGSDLKALAHCMRASRKKILHKDLVHIQAPVLVAVGSQDTLGGSPHSLAALMPSARGFSIQGRDHMNAVGDKTYKTEVLSFFNDTSI